jgi:ribosomal protein S18 acetylase RimI-like enzyme
MKIEIRPAALPDIAQINKLYEDLSDYLSDNQNYPGWRKGIYPTYEDACIGFQEQALYVASDEEKIAGSIILRHVPEEGYKQVEWLTENEYSKIYVVYTLAVHPDYLHCGVGKALLDFAEMKAKEEKCLSIRLDVVKGNVPAEKLYQKCGFQYINTVSLGYEEYGLPWYDLYKKKL